MVEFFDLFDINRQIFVLVTDFLRYFIGALVSHVLDIARAVKSERIAQP